MSHRYLRVVGVEGGLGQSEGRVSSEPGRPRRCKEDLIGGSRIQKGGFRGTVSGGSTRADIAHDTTRRNRTGGRTDPDPLRHTDSTARTRGSGTKNGPRAVEDFSEI
eukprot:scaffold867_cov317-Pavlova_lutheri.AAC.54